VTFVHDDPDFVQLLRFVAGETRIQGMFRGAAHSRRRGL
jgi:hypothetical protein